MSFTWEWVEVLKEKIEKERSEDREQRLRVVQKLRNAWETLKIWLQKGIRVKKENSRRSVSVRTNPLFTTFTVPKNRNPKRAERDSVGWMSQRVRCKEKLTQSSIKCPDSRKRKKKTPSKYILFQEKKLLIFNLTHLYIFFRYFKIRLFFAF